MKTKILGIILDGLEKDTVSVDEIGLEIVNVAIGQLPEKQYADVMKTVGMLGKAMVKIEEVGKDKVIAVEEMRAVEEGLTPGTKRLLTTVLRKLLRG